MKSMKRCFSSVITFFMLFGIVPTNAQADEKKSNNNLIKAEEVEGTPRLDELQTKPNELQVENLYHDDEFVTVIVEMEEAPVMDYYENSSYYNVSDEETAGEAVADFLASEDAKATSNEILKSQENVVSMITKLVSETSNVAARSTETFEVINNWSTIVNAMAVRIPYGMLDEISSLDGVKRAYVQHIYERPEPVENSVVEDGKESYSYSYDMVGINEAWEEGYTGKEMLVAVLDTGLDLKVDSYSNIVRVHEAFTDDSFKSGNPTDGVDDWSLRYTGDSLKEFLANNQLNSTTGSNGNQITYEYNGLYKNLKVPYACDYAEGDLNVYPPESNHGTHVSGTIAGFVQTEEGEVKFSGVSPDAQILSMKVFPDTALGAEESVIINALEDTLKLGADIVNLSLGSDNGFADDDTVQNDIYKRVNAAGIVLMTSAGNSDKSSTNNNYDGNTLTANPDESMISSPAVYNSNLSVASIDNTIAVRPYLTWKDEQKVEHKVYFSDPWSVAMKTDFSDAEYPIYAVGGVGTYDDYYNTGFNNGYNNGKTGLALVKRGEISFVDKINNGIKFAGMNSHGEAYGVLGVIIYDNNPEGTEIIQMSASGTSLDSAFISGKDGAEIVKAIESGYEVKIKVAKEDETIDNPTAGQMSSFTSWGAGPGLELKPEITAPGGNIWSTIVDSTNPGNDGYTGSYDMMSGTSMAAPHMTGIGALVRGRIMKESAFKGMDSKDIGDTVSQLLMSTAIPQKDANGAYYSPRQQGAGLVNAAAAIKTPAYLTVDGKNVGKLELGDDPEKDGKLDFNFNLNNISNDTLRYNAEIVLMRPATATTDSTWGERKVIADNDTIIKTVPLGEVSVEANSSTSFSKSVSLTKAERAKLDSLFENGTYVEGYIILRDATESGNPQIGLPMLSYYGDWSKAPIFDTASWIDEPEDGENPLNNECTWKTNVVGSTQINEMYGVIDYFNLGQNLFDSSSEANQVIYNKENITLSPNGDEYFDRIDNYVLYQLRDAKMILVEAKDAETGEVYMRDWTAYSSKSLYNANYGMVIPFSVYDTFPSWDGTNAAGEVLPTGTKCIYSIYAYGEGDYGDDVYNSEADRYVTNFDSVIPNENEPTFNGHKMDMTGDVISFPVTIDTVAPKLENNAVSIYEKDGHTYITGKVYDEDGSIASVEITPYVTRTYKEGYGDPSYSEVGIDRNNPFYINNVYDAASKELTFTVDVTEYAHINESYAGENNYYDYTWNGNVLLSCGDYGTNDRSYAIKVDATSGIVLSQTSALLKVGNEFDLSVNNNTYDSQETITRVSSNPEVASIDEYGHVTALAPGQTTITVSNGISSADCIVAVEEQPGKVTDFQLSMDSFSGLKPNGQLVVKVQNLQPANAKIDSIRWEVWEDEEYANDYASGLITVGKNSSDSLSGFLYLTIDNSTEILPPGHATLTVTIDGVVKSMVVDWDQIYQSKNDDDIISSENYNDQAIYIKQGETANLKAQYRQSTLHQVGDVNTELTGLKLDGADFFSIGGSYQAKLVNEEGYALPSDIHLYTVYSDGSKTEIKNYPQYTVYSYDQSTGEISLYYAPSGAENKLLIVADGVESEGTPAGVMSGNTYTRPDEMDGPFDWAVTEGTGEIEIDNDEKIVKYTPSEPGVSYITATTKDGQYHVNFAVVSEPILADTIELDTHKAEMKVGETINPKATLSPIPTTEEDQELVWTSFNQEVATVSEEGTITAVGEGYAYIKVESATNCNVMSYCIIKVNENVKNYKVIFKDYDGTILKEEMVQEGNSAIAPEDPKREGYNFTGWDKEFDKITEDLIVTAQYSKIEDSDDEKPSNPDTPEDPETPVNPENPSNPVNPGTGASGGDGSGTNGNKPSGNTGTNKPTSSNNSSTGNKMPVTGGEDARNVIFFAVGLCLIGAYNIIKNKKI